MKLLCLLLLALQAPVRSDDDLHEARIYLVEKDDAGMRRDFPSVDGFPDFLPLELHTETTRLTGMLLVRNTKIDQGFDIVSYDKEFSTIRAGELKTGAFYQDQVNLAAFGVKDNDNGQREYQGSFTHKGQRYSLNVDNSVKRHASEGLTYIARHVDSTDYAGDSLPGFDMDTIIDEKVEKRSTDYNVEMAIFVEYSEYKVWRNLGGSQENALSLLSYKFSYTLNAMDLAYRSVSGGRDGFTVTPWIKSLLVNTNGTNSPIHNWVRGIDTTKDPKGYQFLDQHILFNMASWAPGGDIVPGKDTDVTMFWCRYDLLDENGWSGRAGLAYISGVCSSQYGFSVVEDTGFETWQTAAHELAHNLGSNHDGEKDAVNCNPEDRYIMTNVTGFPDPAVSRTAGYEFSACSIAAMKKTLSQTNCLYNSGFNGFNKVDVSIPPGKIIDRTTQCKLIFGDQYHDMPSQNTDISCWQGLRCTVDDHYYIWKTPPADGTDCGNGKSCYRGYCQ